MRSIATFEFRYYQDEDDDWCCDYKTEVKYLFFKRTQWRTHYYATSRKKLLMLETMKHWIERQRKLQRPRTYTYFSADTIDKLIAEEKAKTDANVD